RGRRGRAPGPHPETAHLCGPAAAGRGGGERGEPRAGVGARPRLEKPDRTCDADDTGGAESSLLADWYGIRYHWEVPALRTLPAARAPARLYPLIEDVAKPGPAQIVRRRGRVGGGSGGEGASLA